MQRTTFLEEVSQCLFVAFGVGIAAFGLHPSDQVLDRQYCLVGGQSWGIVHIFLQHIDLFVFLGNKVLSTSFLKLLSSSLARVLALLEELVELRFGLDRLGPFLKYGYFSQDCSKHIESEVASESA